MNKSYYWSMAQRDFNIYKTNELRKEFLFYARKEYDEYKNLGGKRKFKELEEIL